METRIAPDLLVKLTERASATEHFVLRLDTPNKNGRTYPTDVFFDAWAKVKYPMFGCFMDDLQHGSVPLGKISHKVIDIRVVGDEVFAKIIVLPKLIMGHVLQQLGDVDYRTTGSCQIDANGIVSDFSLISICAVPKGTGA